MNLPSDEPARSTRSFTGHLWLVPAAVTFLVGIGFLFHTSFDPILFGKYNLRYIVFLGAWFLVLTPAVGWLTRFLFRPDSLKLSRGREIVVTVRQKLYASLVLGLVGYIAVGWYVDYQLATQVLSHNPNVFHPYLQNVPRPNHAGLHINRWGFRGDDIEQIKSPGHFRIFVYGGSTVFCGTVPYEQSHAYLLQELLKQAYPQLTIEVQNLGAEWHCSQHSLMKLLFQTKPFDPDLVIMFHGINDLCRSLVPEAFCQGDYRTDYGHYLGAVTNLVRPTATLDFLARTTRGHWFSDFRFDQVRLHGPTGNGLNGSITLFYPRAEARDDVQWKSLPDFERNLRDFVRVAQWRGYQVLLGTQASLYHDDMSEFEESVLGFAHSHQAQGTRPSTYAMKTGMERFNQSSRRVAEDLSIPLVDLEHAVPKRHEFLYDDVHYTAAGNRLIAEAMARFIIEANLIK